jgi:bifunctional DNase/RNase
MPDFLISPPQGRKMTQHSILKIMTFWGLVIAAAACPLAAPLPAENARAAPDKEELVRVTVFGLMVDPASQQPVVTLADPDQTRALPIWIGLNEARAIHAELQGIEHFRPLTHDLLARILNRLNCRIQRVIITHTQDNIFFATVALKKDESLIEIDARPSDAVVMALKFKAPIFVSTALFESMSVPLEAPAGIEEKYGLTLQELTPEMAKYLSFGSQRGVMVADLRKESRAQKDGLEAGDIIVEIAGQPVASVASLKDVLAKSSAPVEARIFRNKRFLTLTLHLE